MRPLTAVAVTLMWVVMGLAILIFSNGVGHHSTPAPKVAPLAPGSYCITISGNGIRPGVYCWTPLAKVRPGADG